MNNTTTTTAEQEAADQARREQIANDLFTTAKESEDTSASVYFSSGRTIGINTAIGILEQGDTETPVLKSICVIAQSIEKDARYGGPNWRRGAEQAITDLVAAAIKHGQLEIENEILKNA